MPRVPSPLMTSSYFTDMLLHDDSLASAILVSVKFVLRSLYRANVATRILLATPSNSIILTQSAFCTRERLMSLPPPNTAVTDEMNSAAADETAIATDT